ncbi:hypothetical protein [Neoaquamicrobium sediminum]|uniref:hypothetical protein n=1 Tax=Neoaquamicrobium sediminum TaxID=1849104 RepID=UPI003BAAB86C
MPTRRPRAVVHRGLMLRRRVRLLCAASIGIERSGDAGALAPCIATTAHALACPVQLGKVALHAIERGVEDAAERNRGTRHEPSAASLAALVARLSYLLLLARYGRVVAPRFSATAGRKTGELSFELAAHARARLCRQLEGQHDRGNGESAPKDALKSA